MSRYFKDIGTPAQNEASAVRSVYGLEHLGLTNLHTVYWNLPTEALYEEIVFRSEGHLSDKGPIAVNTGEHTALAANDKFIVREGTTEHRIWWGQYNRPFSPDKFGTVFQRLLGFLQGRDLFVQDRYAGADPNYRLPVRIITEYAWHSLFARNIFIAPESTDELRGFVPEFTVIVVPSFKGLPQIDGTLSKTFILLNFDQKLCLIGNTGYSGEIRSSVFTALNFLLPLDGILTMRCAANVGSDDDVALFCGLPGAGKTTLSADPKRRLIANDELGWSDEGIFNLESGCYTRIISLTPADQPQIYACTRKFGTVLESVTYDPISRQLRLDGNSLSEIARAAYPLEYIDNALPEKRSGHPRNIVMLTCDAFGVMPPIARLTPEQAAYHFISGYGSNAVGVGADASRDPAATFSACFGAESMVHHPGYYAELLKNKIRKHDAACWLINTGWTGGPIGIGNRMSIQHTSTLLHAALAGELRQVEYRKDPVFGFEVPKQCQGVPGQVLDSSRAWGDPAAYQDALTQLASLFIDNFKKFRVGCPADVIESGPIRQPSQAMKRP